MTDRTILAVTGADRAAFLQDLVTNDVAGLERGLVYAALLSAQGKYLADFLMVPAPDAILLDVAEGAANALIRRLTMYRLRRDVAVARADLSVTIGGEGHPDPRHPALPRRLYGPASGGRVSDALRIEHVIPETGIELVADETYILEAGFERLNGVDFRKGCYVGQEVTARMKHKTELRKGPRPRRDRRRRPAGHLHRDRGWPRRRNAVHAGRGARPRPSALRPRDRPPRGWRRDDHRLGALGVFHSLGVHDDALVLADEGRDHDAHAVVEHRRLEAVRRRLALHDGLGLDDLARYLLRQLRAEGLGLVVLDLDGHPVLQEGTAIAEDVGRQLDLLEALLIHEDEHAVALVEELLVLLFQAHALDLVGAAEPLVELAAISQVLQLHLREGTSLAGLHVIDLHGRPEAAIVLERVSGTDFVSVDLGHERGPIRVVRGLRSPISAAPKRFNRCGCGSSDLGSCTMRIPALRYGHRRIAAIVPQGPNFGMARAYGGAGEPSGADATFPNDASRPASRRRHNKNNMRTHHMADFVDGTAYNHEQGNRARKLFAAVVLAALDDAIADDKKYGNGPEQIARWARSRDGREVLSCAGIDPNERVVNGLMEFVGKGVRTSVALSREESERRAIAAAQEAEAEAA